MTKVDPSGGTRSQRTRRAVCVIDSLLSLALALHHSKGAYALLFGSGISRPASIPPTAGRLPQITGMPE